MGRRDMEYGYYTHTPDGETFVLAVKAGAYIQGVSVPCHYEKVETSNPEDWDLSIDAKDIEWAQVEWDMGRFVRDERGGA